MTRALATIAPFAVLTATLSRGRASGQAPIHEDPLDPVYGQLEKRRGSGLLHS